MNGGFTWTDWGQGVLFDGHGSLKAVVFGYFTTQTWTTSIDVLDSYVEKIDQWAHESLDSPNGVPQPFWMSDLGFYYLQDALNTGAYQAAGVALVVVFVVLLVIVGNVVMAMYAFISIFFILGCVVWFLIGCGWVLDLMTAVVLAICAGMCVD